jgi:hypothetical protein
MEKSYEWVPPINMLSSSEPRAGDGDASAAAAEEEEASEIHEFEGEDPPVELSLSPLLGGLALEVPEVFEREILARLLSEHDVAMLARTCRGVRAVVLASELPRAGALRRRPSFSGDEDQENNNERVQEQETQPTLLSAKHFTRRLPLLRWALANGMPLHWRTMEYAGRVWLGDGGRGASSSLTLIWIIDYFTICPRHH